MNHINGLPAPHENLVPLLASGRAITSAAAARDHVRSLLRDHWSPPQGGVGPDAVTDLLLVVSELVTNAIRHGGGLAGFTATVTDGGILLDVRDNSDVVPTPAHGTGEFPQRHQVSGYGWPLIIQLSRDITIEPGPRGGKTVRVFVPLA
ncbi:ATP-binding protein [Streptomyces siamensis]|uniref:ATP-binding protein n=1 Tax=Streptomyces siamensis TaxID=1274986 RepID=A0ABP9IQ53_9ACTN